MCCHAPWLAPVESAECRRWQTTAGLQTALRTWRTAPMQAAAPHPGAPDQWMQHELLYSGTTVVSRCRLSSLNGFRTHQDLERRERGSHRCSGDVALLTIIPLLTSMMSPIVGMGCHHWLQQLPWQLAVASWAMNGP
jgi:hypothetical protein